MKKENENEEVDLFDIICFIMKNKIIIMSFACLGLLLGGIYIFNLHSTTNTKIIIPVKVEYFDKNNLTNNLNLDYFNSIVKNYNRKLIDSVKQKELKNSVWEYYLNPSLMVSNNEKDFCLKVNSLNPPKIVSLPSLRFLLLPSGYAFEVQSAKNDLNANSILDLINYSSCQFNKFLVVSFLGKPLENENVALAQYILNYKEKLATQLFEKQITLKKISNSFDKTSFQSIKLTDINLNANVSAGDNLNANVSAGDNLNANVSAGDNLNANVSAGDILSQIQKFILVENFKSNIIQKELEHKINSDQKEKEIQDFLGLIKEVKSLEKKLDDFPENKFLPSFSNAGSVRTEVKVEESISVKKLAIVLFGAFISGCVLGVLVALGKAFKAKLTVLLQKKFD